MSSGFINPATSTVVTQPDAGSFAGRRRTINGNMKIDQANGGAAVNVAAAGPIFSVDKFIGNGTVAAGVFTLQRTVYSGVTPNNFANLLKMTVTTPDAAPAAGAQYFLSTKIENGYLEDLRGISAAGLKNPAALGFWMRSSITGTFSGSVRNVPNNVSYPFSWTYSTANVMQFVPLQIPVSSVGSMNGLIISWDFGSGANSLLPAGAWSVTAGITGATGQTSLMAVNGATFELTGVQLEPGSVCTIFEEKPDGEEIRLCQREFCKSFLLATAPVQNNGINSGNENFPAGIAAAATDFFRVKLPVVMRATPAITTFNPAAANAQVRDETAAADCSATGTFNVTENGFSISTTGNAATVPGNRLSVHWQADARL